MLVYNMKGGVNYRDVSGNTDGMAAAEREWWIVRLDKQIKKENAAMKAAGEKAKKKKK